jgi:cytochrome c5
MAEVFLAVQRGIEGFEKLVVLKQILPHLREQTTFVQMFLEEARLAARLRHPNIVSVLDIKREDDTFGMVLDYISGEDLRYVLGKLASRDERIPAPLVCRIASDIAAGLHHAHTLTDSNRQPLGIVHRDVALSNVILDYEGVTRLVDFGIAKAESSIVQTNPGVVKGKFGYMAPEQIKAQPLDHRADIFSLGVVMYEMLTGRRLFRAPSHAAVVDRVLTYTPPVPSDTNSEVPPELDALVMSTLAKNRDDRPATADKMRQQLEDVLAQIGPASHGHTAKWMTTTFAARRDSRLAMERRVLRDDGGDANNGSYPELELGLTSLSGAGMFGEPRQSHVKTGPHQPGRDTGAAIAAVPPTRSRTPLVILLVLLVIGLSVALAYLLGRGSSGPPVATRPSKTTATATAVVHVHPPGATVQVGDKSYQNVGAAGTMLGVAADKDVTITISKTGFQTTRQVLRLTRDATRHVHVNLTAQAVAAVTTPSARETSAGAVATQAPAPTAPAPTPTAAPAPAPAPTPAPATTKAAKARRAAAAKRWRNTMRKRRGASSPKAARLSLAYSPVTAKVTIDGKVVASRSPASLTLPAGNHLLRLSAPGYVTQDRQINVANGAEKALSVALSPAMGVISISSSPAGATISINGVPRGKTPLRGVKLDPRRAHRIVVERAGYQRWVSQLTPRAGANAPLMASLKGLVRRPAVAPTAPAKQPVRALVVASSRGGNASSGRGLFASRCNSCHGKSASRISPRRYTQRQWSRYFANGRHVVRAPLRKHLNGAQLAHVKAFLMSRAADVETATAAGVR